MDIAALTIDTVISSAQQESIFNNVAEEMELAIVPASCFTGEYSILKYSVISLSSWEKIDCIKGLDLEKDLIESFEKNCDISRLKLDLAITELESLVAKLKKLKE